MKLEDQVVNLELSQRLKEFGVNQESLYWWLMHDGCGEPEAAGDIFIGDQYKKDYFCVMASAFTVAELGEMLPINIKMNEHKKLLNIKHGFNWHVNYEEINTQDIYEANARAKMLIYLIENKLMKIKNE